MQKLLEVIKANVICTDSREIKPGQYFLPLVGANFDGHDYLTQIISNGAAGAFYQKSFALTEQGQKVINTIRQEFPSAKLIEVTDTLEAYQSLARAYRQQVNPLTIAITGSSGKTTSKEMLRYVLAEQYKVHYTQANFNNEIGVPKTILSMPEDTEVLIVEMGMRGLGEIQLLSEIAEPNMALITNVGTAHIERLGSVENIQKAKLEVIAGLKAYDANLLNKLEEQRLDSLLVLDQNLHQKLEQENPNFFNQDFKIQQFNDSANFRINGLAAAAIHSDANAIAIIARELALNEKQIQSGLDKYETPSGRGNFFYDAQDNLFIDDSYNANPDSVRASFDALMQQFPEEQKYFVLGEIKESNPALIADLHEYITVHANQSEKKLSFIDARGYDLAELAQHIREELLKSPKKKNVVLIKGSRNAALEQLVKLLLS